MSDLGIGFPQVSSPFVDGNRRIDQAWLQLLITLWNRTGAQQGQGVDALLFSETDVLARISELEQLVSTAVSSVPPPVPTPPLSEAYARHFLLMGG